ncbi:hypothetical protein MYAM1_000323 [Malassezia yamatoensis]|uniref:Uncharacterized protein n=1 Tax=Malassezia yamatoensis TaxID=253288 RepID=A0AAJ5YPA6_9BASI|nr:hypothetical protein MYAM1_000323 [Malassezia yamatoensis]
MPAPKLSKAGGQHKTFDLEDESYGESTSNLDQGSESQGSETLAAEENNSDVSESDSGSDVEEITTQSARQAARANQSAVQKQREEEHANRRERQQLREKTASKSRRTQQRHRHDEPQGTETIHETRHSKPARSSSSAQSVAQLDPSLFAAAFAHQDARARAALNKDVDIKAPVKKRTERGPDGEKVFRVKGGRTVIRALAPEQEMDLIDAPLRHDPLDPSRALPSARERAYRKRKLGLRQEDLRATPIDPIRPVSKTKKPTKKDSDDPLNLNDPAFLEGGEFAHLARPKRKRSTAPRILPGRGAGGRVETPHIPRLGPALHFARNR